MPFAVGEQFVSAPVWAAGFAEVVGLVFAEPVRAVELAGPGLGLGLGLGLVVSALA